MREILFKAKRIGNGEWVEGWLIKGKWYFDKSEIFAILPTDLCIYPRCEFSECIEIDKDTICQYTGLVDKNGNKIWENDVVKEESCGYVGVVKYVDCEYLIDWNDFPYIRRDMMFWVKERGLKVIGTKFDNPELLGG